MKTMFKIDSLTLTIEGNPIELKGLEISSEASAQEIATSGGFINQMVETIGDIAERFDNNTPVVKEINVEPKVEPVEVKTKKVSKPIKPELHNDFREIKSEIPELPTATFHGGEPIKKNITKAWRAIPVPEEFKSVGTNKYRWEGKKGVLGDSVSVNGQTYGIVYIHIYGLKKRSFIIIREDNVEFEDDIRPEEFKEFLDVIDIPDSIKDYIKKVVEL